MDRKDKIIAEQNALIVELRAYIAKLEHRVTELELRNIELERRLGLNSSNSSKPPSSDGLKKPVRIKSLREKSDKKSGGQPGHKGNTLKQVANPDKVIIHYPETCSKCHTSLTNREISFHIKRQVFDIPQPRIEITEHQSAVKICSCGQRNVAQFPAGVSAPVQYGNHANALAVYLNQRQFIPEDRLQEIFYDVFKLSISTATLAGMSSDFASKAAPIQERVFAEVKAAPVKNADETGIRIAGKTEWIHSVSNEKWTHYRASPKRGDVSKDIKGVLVHDHWKPYFTIDGVLHALCNVHHLRELKALFEIEKERWASAMFRLLTWLNRMEDPPLEKAFRIYDDIVRRGLAFHEGQPALSARKNKRRIGHNLLLRLQKYKDAVLRFLTNPDVPFTNNQAEQDVRMMKLRQKISGCFRTTRGAGDFCITRGFLSSCRKQGINLFHAISQVINDEFSALGFTF